jgi:hypothetical protein
MAGLVPAIHVFLSRYAEERGCPGTSPGMTTDGLLQTKNARRRAGHFRCGAENVLSRPHLGQKLISLEPAATDWILRAISRVTVSGKCAGDAISGLIRLTLS